MRHLLFLCLLFGLQAYAHDSGTYPPNDQKNSNCTFTEYSYFGFVKAVIDGDTADVDISMGQDIWHMDQRLRFYDVVSEQGVNAPESRTKDKNEKALGLAAKRWLGALISNQWVIVTTYKDKTGKFGRYLATVCRNGHDVVRHMLDIGMVSVKNY